MATSSSKTILIVDDEPSIREALAAARRRRPALVVLDVEMPNMDGTQTLRELRALDDRIPVVMLTGNTSTQVAGDLIKNGAFSYVPKPVKFQYLDHLVATLLGPHA